MKVYKEDIVCIADYAEENTDWNLDLMAFMAIKKRDIYSKRRKR